MSAVATVEKPTERGPHASRVPSTGWIWLGVCIGVLGLAVAIFWSVIGVKGYLNRVDDLARMSIPGQISVQIPDTGKQFVYYEGQGSASIEQLGIRVTDPQGRTVGLEPYRLDLRYDAPGNSGRVGRALATFSATDVGSYGVNAAGTAPAGSAIAIGESVARNVVPTLLGVVAVFLLSVGGGLALVIATVARRSNARKNSWPMR
jgi:hypothetical protein